MDRVTVTRERLDSLAEAVGSKSAQGVPLTIEQMRDAVLGIETGIQPSGTKTITRNGVSGYAVASVDVRPKLQAKEAHPSSEAQVVTPDSGYDGLVRVDVSGVALIEKVVTPDTEVQTILPTANLVVCEDTSVLHSASITGMNSLVSIDSQLAYELWDKTVLLEFSVIGYGQASGKSDSVEVAFVLSDGCQVRYANDGHYLSSLTVYWAGRNLYLSFGTYWKGVEEYSYSLSADLAFDGISRVTVEPIPSNYGRLSYNGSVLTVY